MTINFQYVHTDISETLNDFTTEKLQKLGNKFSWVIGAEVHFSHEPHPKEDGCICQIELSLPGPRIFATSKERNYELAVKKTIKELETQLKKRKEVFKSH